MKVTEPAVWAGGEELPQGQKIEKPGARRPAQAPRRALLLSAAREEFARRGLEGARVDEIAKKAGVNKQLVYHHFGTKDDLYRHVLEVVYTEIREQERSLKLAELEPEEAMRQLITFSFDYLEKNRDFVALLSDENFHKGRHIAEIDNLTRLHAPLITGIARALVRGREAGLFHADVDPRQLYISIAGLSFFYFSNMYTLSRVFGEPLDTEAAVAARRAHILEFVMRSLRAHAPTPSRDA